MQASHSIPTGKILDFYRSLYMRNDPKRSENIGSALLAQEGRKVLSAARRRRTDVGGLSVECGRHRDIRNPGLLHLTAEDVMSRGVGCRPTAASLRFPKSKAD